MKKMMEQHRKFMKGNAGFSLVELIIVIAIMAALVAILAPQYMKYVEKSRKQADATTAEEIFTACKVVATEEGMASFDVVWDGAKLTITGGANSVIAANTASKLLLENLGLTSVDLVAKAATKTPTYKVVYTAGAASTVAVDATLKGWWN